jgi:DTW domain-containing protein YfiP
MKLSDHPIDYPGRCTECLLKQPLCLCDDIKAFDNPTPVTIIMHRREVYRPSGTSRLARLALKNCDVYLRGHVDNPLDLEALFPDPESCLFMNLSDRAAVLDASLVERRAFTRLVVPDGSWRQARKMGRREPVLKRMQWVRLPDGLVSNYRLRRQPVSGGVATIEAIAMALGILDGPAGEQHLNDALDLLVTRTLRMKLETIPSTAG